MFKNLLAGLKEKALKIVLPHAISGVIGAAALYTVDRGWLDGEAADAVANSLLRLALTALAGIG